MITKHNVPISRVSWLHLPNVNMGIFENLYYPDTIEELIDLCRGLQRNGQSYFVFGHTSNCYFKASFTPPHVIFTANLRHFINEENFVICECGAHIKMIARQMVEEGVKHYDGLWDLPGTVAAGVYGNAGCYGCAMSDITESVEILTPQGDVKIINAEDIAFSRRNSNFKKGVIKGVILRVKLKKQIGNYLSIQERAKNAHQLRMTTQPGPQDNLGSCFMSGEKRIWYKILQRFVRFCIKCLDLKSSPLSMELSMLGNADLAPYLFDINRFIWKDEGAIAAFDKYVRLYHRLHKKAKLEINIFE